MSLIETECLVLKSYNLSEADKIVVFLTNDQGVIRGVAKGAKRLKSKFGSGLEPFSEMRVAYLEKEGQELVSIQRVEIIRSNFAAASNPDFLQKFSYLCDLLISFSPPHDPNETLYRMARACIESAANDPDSLLSTGVYFELWMLRLAGYLPDWKRCGGCERVFAETEDGALRSDFHFVCLACQQSGSSRVLGSGDRSIAAAVLRLSPPNFAAFTVGKTNELMQLSVILKQLIARSIGREVAVEKSLAISK